MLWNLTYADPDRWKEVHAIAGEALPWWKRSGSPRMQLVEGPPPACAQVHEAPVIVRDFTDEEVLAVALIENIQRENLNAMEEAQALHRLQHEFELTQQELFYHTSIVT